MNRRASIFTFSRGCLTSRNQLKNLLLDVYKGNLPTVSLILEAFDAKIVARIDQADKIDEEFVRENLKYLTAAGGISESNAKAALKFWITEYGEIHSGKTIIRPSKTPKPLTQEQKKDSAPENQMDPASTPPVKRPIIDLDQCHVGVKLPKTVFVRNKQMEQKIGVSGIDLTAVVHYKNEDWINQIRVTGRIRGQKNGTLAGASKARHFLHVVIHNEKGEPISIDKSRHFEDEDLTLTYMFDMTLGFLPGEKVGGISVTVG